MKETPTPLPKPPKAPNCILNSTLQQNERHMHNKHIRSEIIRNSQFFSMSERKKQYNIITAHHLASQTSD